jgi:hypothetical protein
LFQRHVDSAGLAYWAAQLDQGVSAGQVLRALEASQEFRTNLIGVVYNTYLGRAADEPGITAWSSFLGAGGTIEQLKASIIGSPEYFFAKGGGQNAGFLNAAYQSIFSRPLDVTGASYFSNLLAGGASRALVATLLLTSVEEYSALINLYYIDYLARLPEPAAAAYWVGALQAGLGEAGLVAGILSSDEFLHFGGQPTA